MSVLPIQVLSLKLQLMESNKTPTDLPIALWSGPRNVSTALMYSFANRKDILVMDEPFFGCFLHHTGAARPSRNEVLLTMETNFEKVERTILEAKSTKRFFLKNMANHLEGQSLDHLLHFRNVILVRRPEAVLASYRRQIDQPTLLDLCYRHQMDILSYLKSKGQAYFILDSDDIRRAPEKELTALCDFVGLPFTENMLSWTSGARKEDGVWAKYWYHNVHKSTGFMPFEGKKYDVPNEFAELLEVCNAYYSQIRKEKI